MNIPGEYGIHDVIRELKPNPYPDCVSAFDYEILHFKNLVDDAGGEMARIADCQKYQTRKIEAANKRIQELQDEIAQYKEKILEIRSREDDDHRKEKIAKVRAKIDACLTDIQEERKEIAEANKLIRECVMLTAGWTSEKGRRAKTLAKLEAYRAKGVNTDGSAIPCGEQNEDGKTLCRNPQHFIEPRWGPCPTHRRK